MMDQNHRFPFTGGIEYEARFINQHTFVPPMNDMLPLEDRIRACEMFITAARNVGYDDKYFSMEVCADIVRVRMICPGGVWKNQKACLHLPSDIYEMKITGMDFHSHMYDGIPCLNSTYPVGWIARFWDNTEHSKYNLEYYTRHQTVCNIFNFLINDEDLFERYRGSGQELIESITNGWCSKHLSKQAFLCNLNQALMTSSYCMEDLTPQLLVELFPKPHYILPIEYLPTAHECFIPLRLTRNYIHSFVTIENISILENRFFQETNVKDQPNPKRQCLARKLVKVHNFKKPLWPKDEKIIKKQGGVFVICPLVDMDQLQDLVSDTPYIHTPYEKDRLSDFIKEKIPQVKSPIIKVFLRKSDVKKSQLFREYTLSMPEQMPRQTRYRKLGNQLNINANFWMPFMSDGEENYLFVVKYLDEMSRSFFRLPTMNQFHAAAAVLDIIAKSIVKQMSTEIWRPSQFFLQMVIYLQRLYKYILKKDDDLANEKWKIILNLFIRKRVHRRILPDLGYSMFVIASIYDGVDGVDRLYEALFNEALYRMTERHRTHFERKNILKIGRFGLTIMANQFLVADFARNYKEQGLPTDRDVESLHSQIQLPLEQKFLITLGFNPLINFNVKDYIANPLPPVVPISNIKRFGRINLKYEDGTFGHVCHLCKKYFITTLPLKESKTSLKTIKDEEGKVIKVEKSRRKRYGYHQHCETEWSRIKKKAAAMMRELLAKNGIECAGRFFIKKVK